MDLSKISDTENIPRSEIPEIIGELEKAKARLWARMVIPDQDASYSDGDRLLTVEEASRKLGCSRDRLYRHPKEFRCFEVAFGGSVRFSERGIEAWIARKKKAHFN